ncbi:hypothetical protein JVT61DRAFT_8974 [Boletus reticuloceps]|uniref:Uncharacterized protein n=1 Tax=Boletus reticuloceps TaxID=495285 RepID=A0A8I3A722_9AGAM|nr:hypothetical protein JVT61DRAFT_8974 [Boletus reticuloceps]
MYMSTRQVPEIDGSQGAFIGVVVALSVLIVVCCAAVFYLLRHHEPTDADRTARRERYRHTREQTLHSSTSSGMLDSGQSRSTLGDKVKQMWQSTTGRGPARGGGGRGGRGWIRAGSDDEWTPRSDRRQSGNGMRPGVSVGAGTGADPNVDPELGDRLGSLPVLTSRQDRDARAEGVRIVESPSSDSASGSGAGTGRYGYAFTESFSKTSMMADAAQQSQSPMSSSSSMSSPAVSSPRERASVDERREAHSPTGEDRRHRSVMSNASVWTHGSKFVEDI